MAFSKGKHLVGGNEVTPLPIRGRGGKKSISLSPQKKERREKIAAGLVQTGKKEFVRKASKYILRRKGKVKNFKLCKDQLNMAVYSQPRWRKKRDSL